MNLFDVEHPEHGERFDTLLECRNVVVERIASSADVDGKLYDQDQDEWVALLRGTATLEIEGTPRDLAGGDQVFIAAHRPHRVTSCSADALWLAVHVHHDLPSEPVTIDEGTLADVAALEKTIPEFETAIDEAAMGSRIGDRRHLALIARVDGEPAGFKLGYEENAERFYSWVGAVAPAYRGRGIAQQLLAAQESWCRTNGYREVVVKSYNRFRNMVLLLIRSGYDVHGTQTNGAIVFKKSL